jgi:hypothetical protein
MKLVGLILFLLSFSHFSTAQLVAVENAINKDFELLIDAKTDSVKLLVCSKIQDSLIKTLSDESSFEYPFGQLKSLGKITSPDAKFRIYTWNCMLADGSYRYYGIIQVREKSSIKVKVLADNVDADMFTSYHPHNWPGALYYKIIPFKNKKDLTYILLGWDGNNVSSNKKIIEVLSVGSEGIKFGEPLILWKNKRLNRVIFEYSKQAGMSIEYQEKEKRLVFDHLAPSSLKYTNQFEYYGPDFTHDALVLKNGIWELQENIDIRNK